MTRPLDLIASARRRIRRRNLLAGAAAGGWLGAALAAITILVSRLWWIDLLPAPWLVGLVVTGLAVAFGAVAGVLRPVLSPRELALLVDRALGTDEALITLLHLQDKGQGSPAIRADLERRVAALPALRDGLRAGPPRHARWLPLLVVAAALFLLIPARPPIVAPVGPLAAEAARLAEALVGTPDLPPELLQRAQELIQELADGDLSAEQAAEKLAELQKELAEYQERDLGDAAADLQAMERAARALDEARIADPDVAEALQQASDALHDRDPAAAREAAAKLADALDQANPQDRGEAGQALEQAGQELAQAASPELQELGEALEQIGRELQDSQGGASAAPDGSAGEPQTGDGGEPSATDKLRELARDPDRARELAERLKNDRERLRQSQEANGALEASRQRLGGEPGEQGGEASEGAGGQGSGLGEPQTGLNAPASEGGEATAGAGHTWEDEGTFDTVGGHQDQDRQSDRTTGRVADDFEAFYDPQHLAGAEGLIVSVEGIIDEAGHFDEIERRRTEGTERARRALLDVPDIYREAAERELADDRIPPGYRSAIKDYFDSME